MGVVVARHGQARTQKPCRGLPRLLQETARTQTTTLIPCSMRASGHVYLPACLHVDMLTCRSEEHTSELQSLMRISYAVFCLKKKTNTSTTQDNIRNTKKSTQLNKTTIQCQTIVTHIKLS